MCNQKTFLQVDDLMLVPIDEFPSDQGECGQREKERKEELTWREQ